MDTQRILNRVQKMLNLANDEGASEGERDNAMRMAHATLEKYNLTIADMAEASEQSSKAADSQEPREEHQGMFFGRPWARSVCLHIGKLFYCHYLYTSHRNKNRVKHYFIGRRSNAITAMLMAEFVVKSILREGNRQKRQEMMGNAWLRTFCWGATERVRERVQALLDGTDEKQEKREPGTALVLANYADTERQKNELMVRELYPSLGKGRSGKGYNPNSDAHSRGRSYGNSVSLNTQIGRSS